MDNLRLIYNKELSHRSSISGNKAFAEQKDEVTIESLDEVEKLVSVLCLRISKFSDTFDINSTETSEPEDFYLTIKNWSKKTSKEINHTIDLIHSIENTAVCSKKISLEKKHAVKNAIELDEQCTRLLKMIKEISKSAGIELRLSHFWKYWNTKILPTQRTLLKELRKFRISIAGL